MMLHCLFCFATNHTLVFPHWGGALRSSKQHGSRQEICIKATKTNTRQSERDAEIIPNRGTQMSQHKNEELVPKRKAASVAWTWFGYEGEKKHFANYGANSSPQQNKPPQTSFSTCTRILSNSMKRVCGWEPQKWSWLLNTNPRLVTYICRDKASIYRVKKTYEQPVMSNDIYNIVLGIWYVPRYYILVISHGQTISIWRLSLCSSTKIQAVSRLISWIPYAWLLFFFWLCFFPLHCLSFIFLFFLKLSGLICPCCGSVYDGGADVI